MKRGLLVLAVAAAALLALHAANGNMQKVYGVDDPIMDTVRTLFVMSGKALPSTSGPWSGAEIKAMLRSLDRGLLSPGNAARYDKVLRRLEDDASMGVCAIGGSVSPQAWIHTNTSPHFQTWDNWVAEWADSKQLLSIVGEQHVGLDFYGRFDLTIGTAKTRHPLDGPQIGSSAVWTNIPFLLQNDMKQLDFNFPFKAFVSAGGADWTAQIGRDRVSWGPGSTGNFIIGDHIKYHNMARIATFEDNFKYTFMLLSFVHPQNYYFEGALHSTGYPDGQSAYLDGTSMFIAHRLEWRLFSGKAGFALSEGVMYMSKDNRLDLIALSPAHLYHNNYTRSLTNSILGLEFDWTPAKGLNLYSQVVIDEMVLPGEPIPGKPGDGPAEPTAMGYMLGATYDLEAGPGVLTFNLEGAYTDPYLYLRDGDKQISSTNPYRSQKVGDWGINYVVALREMIGAGGTQFYDEQFLGYKHGGDAIVADLDIGYRSDRDFSLGANLFYMAHGTHDRWTVWTRVNQGVPNPSTPSTSHDTQNHKDPDAQSRDAVEHSIAVSLRGKVGLPCGFSLFAEMDHLTKIHPGNRKANATASDLQLMLGASWEF